MRVGRRFAARLIYLDPVALLSKNVLSWTVFRLYDKQLCYPEQPNPQGTLRRNDLEDINSFDS
jgi:hypothetical protein